MQKTLTYGNNSYICRQKGGTDMEISLYTSEKIWQFEQMQGCRSFPHAPATHIEDNAEQSSVTRK